jgi:hypothetical protein
VTGRAGEVGRAESERWTAERDQARTLLVVADTTAHSARLEGSAFAHADASRSTSMHPANSGLGSRRVALEVGLPSLRAPIDRRCDGERGPVRVEVERVANTPGVPALDRSGVPVQLVPIGAAARKDHREAGASVEMAPVAARSGMSRGCHA